jgi:eukaryotic-like serine/threonine-protein kinase
MVAAPRALRCRGASTVSERFVRCPHCRLPHNVETTLCPVTNKPIALSERKSDNGRSASPSLSPPPIVPKRAAEVEKPLPLVKPAAKAPASPAAGAAKGRFGGVDARGLVGRTLEGKYKIKSILGEGGMGTVYEGSHVALGRAVAIKVLHPNQARKPEAVQRLYQEARSAGSIGHPNICEVYDVGRFDDGSPYLVMEKLEGETLAERIGSDGALPFDVVVDVMSQVLSGLVAAHAKGIVHRDIKPENVFLTRRVGLPPIVKILDFGVSKVLHTEEQEQGLDLTRTGMVMGTPYYLSPEQARGERTLDHRVDIWACGIMLYECLAGRRPFIAPNYNALLVQILQATPRPIREVRPATPSGFDGVLKRALERDRDKRYKSAADFQAELQVLRDRHRPSAASIPIVTAALPVRDAGAPYDAVATPSSGENAPVLDLKKLGDDDTKVLLELRSSMRMPAAKPVALAEDDDDVEELDIDIELEEASARKARASEAPRPSIPSGGDDTLYGMNMTGALIPEAPRVARIEADDERTQVMEPKPRPPVDPDATVRIQRKR